MSVLVNVGKLILIRLGVFPNWPDSSGSIYRRVLTFMFDKPLARADRKVKDDILSKELGNICFKALKEYRNILEDERFTNGDFYDNCPDYFKRTRDLYVRDKDPVYLFLTGGDVSGYVVELDPEGDVPFTFLCDVWNVYRGDDSHLKKLKKEDLERHGIIVKQDNRCKSCGKHHSSGCCRSYIRENHTSIKTVFGVTVKPLPSQPEPTPSKS